MATVNELIRKAYETLGLLEVDSDLPASWQAEGIYYLNEEIGKLNGNGITIPYFSEVVFNLTTGKQSYSIGPSNTTPDVVANRFADVENINITISNIDIPLPQSTRFEAFEISRLVNPTPGIPTEYWVTYNNTQSIITFYLPPNDAYPCKVRGKQELNEFTQNTDISNIPSFLKKYFRYALALELSRAYPSSVWTPGHQSEYNELCKLFTADAQVDVAIRPTTAFLDQSAEGYYLTPIYAGTN